MFLSNKSCTFNAGISIMLTLITIYTYGMKTLNTVLCCETTDPRSHIAKIIDAAMQQKIIIVSSIANFHLTKTDVSDSASWSVFINKDNDFVVMIPLPYNHTLLGSYGFASDQESNPYLHLISTDEIRSLRRREFENKPIDIKHVEKIFDQQSKNSKRFYIAGHGYERSQNKATKIAGLSAPDFKQLLMILNAIHTDFAYIFTCYASGINILEFKRPERYFDIKRIQYPIALQATTDQEATAYHEQLEFKRFFARLSAWLKSPENRSNGTLLEETLKPLLTFNMQAPSLDYTPQEKQNLPSIWFPGSNSFFRSIDIDSSTIITYFILKRFETESLFEKRFTQQVQTRPTFEIGSHTKHLQVFPSNASSLDLSYNGRIPFDFISKIPGKAQHYFKSLSAQQLSFDSLLKSMIHIGTSAKCWFFSHIQCQDKGVDGLMHYSFNNGGNPIAAILYKTENEELYYIESLTANTTLVLNKEEYAILVKNMHTITLPTQAALREATAGNETIESVNKGFANFCQNMHLEIPEENGLQRDKEATLICRLLQSPEYENIGTLLLAEKLTQKNFALYAQMAQSLFPGTESATKASLLICKKLIEQGQINLVNNTYQEISLNKSSLNRKDQLTALATLALELVPVDYHYLQDIEQILHTLIDKYKAAPEFDTLALLLIQKGYASAIESTARAYIKNSPHVALHIITALPNNHEKIVILADAAQTLSPKTIVPQQLNNLYHAIDSIVKDNKYRIPDRDKTILQQATTPYLKLIIDKVIAPYGKLNILHHIYNMSDSTGRAILKDAVENNDQVMQKIHAPFTIMDKSLITIFPQKQK